MPSDILIICKYSYDFRYQGTLNVKSKLLKEEKYGIINAIYSTESISVQTGNLNFDIIRLEMHRKKIKTESIL